MSCEHRDFAYGSKTLSLDINPDKGSASLRFGTRTPSWFYPRRVGETTKIFLMASEVIKKRAEEIGKDILLRGDTSNTNMKLWVLHNLEALGFKFEEGGENSYRIVFSKKYS